MFSGWTSAFLVMSEVIQQWCSHVMQTQVKIIGKSLHEQSNRWMKTDFIHVIEYFKQEKKVLTSFLIPPCCRTVLLARLNFATLAMVSAAKHLSSLLGSWRIFTMVCRPPRSAMARRIWVFLEISFRIMSAPIWVSKTELFSGFVQHCSNPVH